MTRSDHDNRKDSLPSVVLSRRSAALYMDKVYDIVGLYLQPPNERGRPLHVAQASGRELTLASERHLPSGYSTGLWVCRCLVLRKDRQCFRLASVRRWSMKELGGGSNRRPPSDRLLLQGL